MRCCCTLSLNSLGFCLCIPDVSTSGFSRRYVYVIGREFNSKFALPSVVWMAE